MGPPDDDTTEEQAILDAINARTQTFKELADRIDRFPSPQRAFELATLLADGERARGGPAADLRARQVRRIWEAEELTLAELGERLGPNGVTKQRVKKILNDAGVETTRPSRREEPR